MTAKNNFCSAIIASMFLALNAAAQTTSFFFTSSPQSIVGRGETYSVTPSDGFNILAYRPYADVIAVSVGGPTLNSPSWSLYFAAPGNVPLTPGTYLDAEGFPFQNPPLRDWSSLEMV